MSTNKISGDLGEQEVVELVPCPNCSKRLMLLPANYPLVDVQCTGCLFRAQVKTNNSKPKAEIFGAGWDIQHKVLKSGYQMAPLIANYKWKEKDTNRQKIIFYPFIPKKNLKKRNVVFKSNRKDHMMFNYIGLDTLPHFVLYDK